MSILPYEEFWRNIDEIDRRLDEINRMKIYRQTELKAVPSCLNNNWKDKLENDIEYQKLQFEENILEKRKDFIKTYGVLPNV